MTQNMNKVQPKTPVRAQLRVKQCKIAQPKFENDMFIENVIARNAAKWAFFRKEQWGHLSGLTVSGS